MERFVKVTKDGCIPVMVLSFYAFVFGILWIANVPEGMSNSFGIWLIIIATIAFVVCAGILAVSSDFDATRIK